MVVGPEGNVEKRGGCGLQKAYLLAPRKQQKSLWIACSAQALIAKM